MKNETIFKCPFCAELIKADAKKCKWCGEWLEQGKRKGSGATDQGTSDARAVTKGLKQKELHDFMLTGGSLVVLVIAVIIGLSTQSWAWLLGALFGGIAILSWLYYRE